jgi:hypothetical protein
MLINYSEKSYLQRIVLGLPRTHLTVHFPVSPYPLTHDQHQVPPICPSLRSCTEFGQNLKVEVVHVPCGCGPGQQLLHLKRQVRHHKLASLHT